MLGLLGCIGGREGVGMPPLEGRGPGVFIGVRCGIRLTSGGLGMGGVEGRRTLGVVLGA